MFSYYINIYLQFLVRTDYIIIHKDAGRFHSTYYVRYSLRQLKLLILIKKQKEYKKKEAEITPKMLAGLHHFEKIGKNIGLKMEGRK